MNTDHTKEMQIENYKIANVAEILNKLRERKMPVNLAYNFTLLLKRIAAGLDAINLVKSELIKKHTDGEMGINAKHENWSAFAVEYEELMNGTTEIDKLPEITIAQLDTIDGGLSIMQLQALEPFLSEKTK